MKFEKIILASQSPRRKQLLEQAEIPFEIIFVPTDENYPLNLMPKEIAIHIAQNKAIAVKESLSNQDTNGNGYPILSADTIVVLDNVIIGKPKDRDDAISTLKKLSGKKHSVITGVCILFHEKKILFADETFVEFDQINDQQIEYYVDEYKPFDKAGSYAIQEWIGITAIKSIKGDFYNVMGLPVNRIFKELNELS